MQSDFFSFTVCFDWQSSIPLYSGKYWDNYKETFDVFTWFVKKVLMVKLHPHPKNILWSNKSLTEHIIKLNNS